MKKGNHKGADQKKSTKRNRRVKKATKEMKDMFSSLTSKHGESELDGTEERKGWACLQLQQDAGKRKRERVGNQPKNLTKVQC